MAGCKLFVGNIPEEVRKPELRSEFEKYGRVSDLYVNTGFCYVTFDDARSEFKCCFLTLGHKTHEHIQ